MKKLFSFDATQGVNFYQILRCAALLIAFVLMIFGVIKGHAGCPFTITLDVELPSGELLEATKENFMDEHHDIYDKWLQEAQDQDNGNHKSDTIDKDH